MVYLYVYPIKVVIQSGKCDKPEDLRAPERLEPVFEEVLWRI
jgi:hypothetical protein